MSFLYNIPQAGDQLSISQGNILNNFTILGAIAGNASVSSAAINATSGFNWLYLPNNGSTPPVGSSFPAGDIALYASLNATTGQNELYINKRNQATVVQVPATASILSTNSAPAALSVVWTYLPSGLLMKTGGSTGVFSGLTNVTINSGGANGPAFTQLVTVMVCPYSTSVADANFAVRLVAITGANVFQIYISSRTSFGAASGTTGFQYWAFGY